MTEHMFSTAEDIGQALEKLRGAGYLWPRSITVRSPEDYQLPLLWVERAKLEGAIDRLIAQKRDEVEFMPRPQELKRLALEQA